MTTISKNQARILVFLDESDKRCHYAAYIAAKLGISYDYCMQQLKRMKFKEWITSEKSPVKANIKVYYEINNLEALERAKEKLNK